MSGKFNGFTKEDINIITSKIDEKENVSRPRVGSGGGIRRVPDKKKNLPKATQPPSAVNKMLVTEMNDSIDNKIHEAIHFKPLPKPQPILPQDESILQTNYEDLEKYVEEKPSPFKGISLKDFEIQRKLIEEQNKHKKDLLFKAIEQHSERTAAEVKKLQEIKKELSKLDSELAADVSILRKQIETASINYMQIQKNYQNIESMFLKAKLDLHNASEKKELLTEHLCTIIAHNEDRKAVKLTELMEKVGLSSENSLSDETSK